VNKGITAAVRHAITTAFNGVQGRELRRHAGQRRASGLLPYHDFASKVPASLQAELATIKTGIENGTIK
jgi:basic membrane protein A